MPLPNLSRRRAPRPGEEEGREYFFKTREEFDAMIAARARHPAVTATLEEASDVLRQDLIALIATGPVEELGLTTNTQPVMLAAGVAMWRTWLDAGGPKPIVMAGHSLGEYAALVAAGPNARLLGARVAANRVTCAIAVGEGS